jgi:peptidoglycan/LPS O-acetylase OafA/YrhL
MPVSASLRSLTGLRFLAALLVFFFHATLLKTSIPPNTAVNPFADAELAGWLNWLFSKAGFVGVSFFFVLSGFVLTWSAKPGERMRAFWRRRMLKIFPNHLVMFAAAMILFAAAITPVSGALLNLFLLNAYSPDETVYVNVNPASWTLCAELLFYLLFPFLFRLISKIGENRLWFWTGAMILGTVAVQVINTYLIPDTPMSPYYPLSSVQFWFGYFFPVPRLFEFVAGMLLARTVMAGKFPAINPSLALLSMPVGYAAALKVPFMYSFVVATIIPICLVIGAYATADCQGRRTVLQNRQWQWLGEISFGFYICQGVVVIYGRYLLPLEPFSTPVAIGVSLLTFTATLLAGWALYALVERPVMRRWAYSKSKKPPLAVQPELRFKG